MLSKGLSGKGVAADSPHHITAPNNGLDQNQSLAEEIDDISETITSIMLSVVPDGATDIIAQGGSEYFIEVM